MKLVQFNSNTFIHFVLYNFPNSMSPVLIPSSEYGKEEWQTIYQQMNQVIFKKKLLLK